MGGGHAMVLLWKAWLKCRPPLKQILENPASSQMLYDIVSQTPIYTYLYMAYVKWGCIHAEQNSWLIENE